MPEKERSHTDAKKIDLKKPGDAIARKRAKAIKKGDSREISKEEAILVNEGIKAEMAEVDSGKQKTFTSEDIKKEFGL